MIHLPIGLTATLAHQVINFVCATSKITKINWESVLEHKRNYGNVIYAFWHGRQFLLVYSHRFENVTIMTSLSKDGELQTKILSKFGYNLVRGSYKKHGAVQSTFQLIEKIHQGRDVAFAVDGPTGPGFKAKKGVLYLAQKTKRPIIPVSTSAKRKIILNNWDRYLLPLPFNTAVIVYGEAIKINETDNLEVKSKELELELNRITNLADNHFK